MNNIICSPSWFFGIDSILELITTFIAVFIAFYSYKIYRIVKEKKYFAFSLAFLFIAMSFVAKAMIMLLLSLNVFSLGNLSSSIPSIYYLKNLGFIVYMVILVMAYMILFIINYKVEDKNIRSVLLLFALLAVLLSGRTAMYQVFFLVSAILLGFIAKSYYKNYCKTKAKSSLCVFGAFALIFVAQLFFIFYYLQPFLYVIGHVLQLVGYFMLLVNLILVLRK